MTEQPDSVIACQPSYMPLQDCRHANQACTPVAHVPFATCPNASWGWMPVCRSCCNDQPERSKQSMCSCKAERGTGRLVVAAARGFSTPIRMPVLVATVWPPQLTEVPRRHIPCRPVRRTAVSKSNCRPAQACEHALTVPNKKDNTYPYDGLPENFASLRYLATHELMPVRIVLIFSSRAGSSLGNLIASSTDARIAACSSCTACKTVNLSVNIAGMRKSSFMRDWCLATHCVLLVLIFPLLALTKTKEGLGWCNIE